MHNLIIEREHTNAEALDSALRDALGASLLGVSARRGEVTVHLADSVAPATVEQARAIVLAHNPAQPTAAQQARVDRAAAIAAMRALGTPPLNPDDYSTDPPRIRALVRTLAWLEQELRDLRGL